MTIAGEVITAVHLPRRIRVDIAVETPFEGFVPEYECREAAIFGNFNWTEWNALDAYERAACIAHHRMHMLVEAHVNEAVYKYNNAKSKPGG